MKKKITMTGLFIIWLVLELIAFSLTRNGAIGELYRDPYNYNMDWWLVLALIGIVPVACAVLYVIIWVWIIRPLKNLKK